MGFEIPYRAYISKKIVSSFSLEDDFDSALRGKYSSLSTSSPQFLRNVLPKVCKNNTIKKTYQTFLKATTSTDEIVTTDIEVPMVGSLNIVTFAFPELFNELYSLFINYNAFCDSAEAYRYARNKLDHPGCRTLEDSHLTPVLSFVKDICIFLDDEFFFQKTKQQLLCEVSLLQRSRNTIPVRIHNLSDIPLAESRIVCRDSEIAYIKSFIYGDPEDLRKKHSFCIYGYGGVGKTALACETIKQIIRDLQDNKDINDYSPKYILFFSAKKRKLVLSAETDKYIEQQIRFQFETADELIELIMNALQIENLRGFRDDGLVVVDNLETLPNEERTKIKKFIDTQTPSEMQFIITSRNSEDYETNFKLGGFDEKKGKTFIKEYIDENMLDLSISEDDEQQLLSLSKGNTLVLVLCMRRLSKYPSSMSKLVADFSVKKAWESVHKSLTATPSNAYEVVAEFMYKDTFEHIEIMFSENIDLFYKVLKVFAIINNENGTDINTICLLIDASYPDTESVMDVLCNYLIIEKKDTQYVLNGFAEKYIISRFLPDTVTFDRLSVEIKDRQRQVSQDLKKLDDDMRKSDKLTKIMKDWLIISDIDRITAAKMYTLYGEVVKDCKKSSKFHVKASLEEFINECSSSERMTAHPYIKYQKARVFQLIDESNILSQKHHNEICKGFADCIYAIKTIDQYSGIQQTKSYASMLWIYGLYLSNNSDIQGSIRFLEEAKNAFEENGFRDGEYYKCVSKLGALYLDYYLQERETRVSYLRRSRSISRELNEKWRSLGKARQYAADLKKRLESFGQY